MVSWASHKHSHTADSSCYAEYITLHGASHEVIFLRQLLDSLHMLQLDPTLLYATATPHANLLKINAGTPKWDTSASSTTPPGTSLIAKNSKLSASDLPITRLTSSQNLSPVRNPNAFVATWVYVPHMTHDEE